MELLAGHSALLAGCQQDWDAKGNPDVPFAQHCSAGGGAGGCLDGAADDLMRGELPWSSSASRLLPSCRAAEL